MIFLPKLWPRGKLGKSRWLGNRFYRQNNRENLDIFRLVVRWKINKIRAIPAVDKTIAIFRLYFVRVCAQTKKSPFVFSFQSFGPIQPWPLRRDSSCSFQRSTMTTDKHCPNFWTRRTPRSIRKWIAVMQGWPTRWITFPTLCKTSSSVPRHSTCNSSNWWSFSSRDWVSSWILFETTLTTNYTLWVVGCAGPTLHILLYLLPIVITRRQAPKPQ